MKKFWSFIKKVVLYFFIFSIGITIIYRFVPPPVTFLMLQRVLEQKFDGKEMKLQKDWVPIEEISTFMQRAVIASEDQHFISHWGFDLEAIEKAYNSNKKSKRIKGGSTITQQTAKNVFLWPARSYIRKALEAYFTILIELFWSKERILEVYLNSIEMGDGVYGIEAASQHYFNKPAKDLSKRESAAIAAILPNPRKWSASKPNAYIQKRQFRILKKMKYIPKPKWIE
jgi:monofunctional biosynthetic peptidoglycan transglycosylase